MIVPAVFSGGIGGMAVMVGGGTFVLVLAGIIAYFWFQRDSGDPWDEFVEGVHAIVEDEDADAIAFIPYSDGPLIPKPALYDRELLGGKGGYRTPDGERIYIDGEGSGKFSLEGVDVIMAIDPTEHAAAADPIKAHIAHEKDLGKWIKVDREGNLIEAGEALTPVEFDGAIGEDVEPAMDQPKTAKTDGGKPVSEVHRVAVESDMELEDAKAHLESAGLLHKIVDVASPREAVIDEETGEVRVEEATHVGVDVSDASDMLPKKTNTTDWQNAMDKARQEGRDDDKIRESMVISFVVGAVCGGGIGVVMALMFAFF